MTDKTASEKNASDKQAALERLGTMEDAERKVSGAIDPGARALVVAVAVLVLLLSFALPHTGSANGWDVLAGDSDAIAESIALPSRIFVWLTLVFSVIFSTLALVTQKWALAWIALYGSGVATVFGLLAIWSRQTLPSTSTGAGPGAGLVLAWIVVAVLTFHWLRAVWLRSTAQLAAAERRRIATAEADARAERGPADFS